MDDIEKHNLQNAVHEACNTIIKSGTPGVGVLAMALTAEHDLVIVTLPAPDDVRDNPEHIAKALKFALSLIESELPTESSLVTPESHDN
jgi:hypothetical protein